MPYTGPFTLDTTRKVDRGACNGAYVKYGSILWLKIFMPSTSKSLGKLGGYKGDVVNAM